MSAEFTQDTIDYIIKVKEEEKRFLELISSAPEGVDKRWQSIAKTHIQEGRMALVRSVTEK